MHGEHRCIFIVIIENLGSSPYARGAPYSISLKDLGSGIIPVCTGSTNKDKPVTVFMGDHPRMHGEHDHRQQVGHHPSGSSPYARGALVVKYE